MEMQGSTRAPVLHCGSPAITHISSDCCFYPGCCRESRWNYHHCQKRQCMKAGIFAQVSSLEAPFSMHVQAFSDSMRHSAQMDLKLDRWHMHLRCIRLQARSASSGLCQGISMKPASCSFCRRQNSPEYPSCRVSSIQSIMEQLAGERAVNPSLDEVGSPNGL